MNALVEDQNERLRKALDSDDTRNWLSETQTEITVGRYNGKSWGGGNKGGRRTF